MPAKTPRKPILRRTLNAKDMKFINKLYSEKRIKPLSTEKKPNAVIRMRKMGDYLIKRRFRQTPEQKQVVEILYGKNKAAKKAELILNYFKKKRKLTTKKAINHAVRLLKTIKQKAKNEYLKPYKKTTDQAKLKNNHFAGEEHMFMIDTLYMGTELVIEKLEKMK